MQIHEVCNIFPMMGEDDFRALKEDIRAHGQSVPILTFKGKVIDGRNRLKACEELGIAPKTEEWGGSKPLVDFIVGLNLHRRHLSSGQRAACGTEIEERLATEAKARQAANARATAAQKAASKPIDSNSQSVDHSKVDRPVSLPKATEQAAKLVGSNRQYIQDAKAVKAASPDLHEKVKQGVITLPQAKREVARQEKRETLEAKAKAVPAKASRPWEIVTGDCVEVLRKIEAGSVRLIFTDPPYNIGIEYGDHFDDRQSAAEYLGWCKQWIEASVRALTPDGSMWVLINDEWADEFGCMLRRCGLHRRAWLKWYEAFGVNCANNFNRCSRHLFYMVKDPKRFVFNADAVSRPSDRQLKYGDKRADPGGKLWDDVWGINPPIPRLVGTAAERIPDFPTQLPLALLTAVVGCASEPGDLVADPFNGSGTTGEASIRLGRRYMGVEKSATFADIARKRLLVAMEEPNAA